MALVIAVEDLATKKSGRFVFARSPVHVGRSELSDLCLPLPFVSLFHGVIRFKDQGIVYVDSGSKNGSELDGVRLGKGVPTPIPPGATLTIGTLRLRPSVDPAAAPQRAEAVRRSLFGDQREALDAVPGATRVMAPLPRHAEEEAPERDGPRSGTPKNGAPGGGTFAEPQGERQEQTVFARLARAGGDRTPASRPEVAVPAPAPATEQAPPEPEVPLVRTDGVEEVLRSVSNDYSAYRSKFAAMQRAITSQLQGLSPEERRSALVLLGGRYPALLQEYQFRELAEGQGVQPARPPGAREQTSRTVIASGSLGATHEPPSPMRVRDAGALKALNQFAQAYAPSTPTLKAGAEVTAFLDRVAQVLEAFAKAFVELRKGHAQFGAELAVRIGEDRSALGRARNLQDVLSHLLEESKDSFARVEELTRAFADLMIHQVALLNGTRAGARGLLEQLSPEVLAHGPGAGLGGKLFGRIGLWNRFVERHQELLEDERQLSQALFGPEFARAYAAVAGGAFDDEDDDEANTLPKRHQGI